MTYRGRERVKKQRSIPRIEGDAEGLRVRREMVRQILTHRVKFQITLEISREICPPVGSMGKNFCVLPTASFLLVCKRLQRGPSGNEKFF